jgi:hypothetical protein
MIERTRPAQRAQLLLAAAIVALAAGAAAAVIAILELHHVLG